MMCRAGVGDQPTRSEPINEMAPPQAAAAPRVAAHQQQQRAQRAQQSSARDIPRAAPINVRGAKQRIAAERRANPTFNAYLIEIEQTYPLLDGREERECGRVLIAGRAPIGPITPAAQTARDRLICCNLRLVVSIAAVYADQGVPLPDIVSAGVLGLIRAVDKYQPRGNVRFGTHATWWIRESCSRYVIDRGPLIRLPRNVATNRRRIHKIERVAECDGQLLDTAEMAAAAALTPAQVQRARAAADTVLSLDAEICGGKEDGETTTLGETLADESAQPLDALAAARADQDELYRKLATILSPRERLVIAMRYGLGTLGGVEMGHAEIGRKLAMNRETVRQVELGALAKLRHAYDAGAEQLPLLFGQAV